MNDASSATRSGWLSLADRMIEGLAPYATPRGASFHLPGFRASIHGRASDGLEGFARSFLLLAFRLAHEPETFSSIAVERYLNGLRAGVSSDDERWPILESKKQSLVEAASIAIGLHFSKHIIWDRLDERSRDQLCAWLAEINRTEPRQNNQVLFHGVVNAFLRSVDRHHEDEVLEASLSAIEDWYVGDGWYSDGRGTNFDYYNAWAFHYYPPIIASIAGLADRRAVYTERCNELLSSYGQFFGSSGSPVYFGRSLMYRLATITPVWVGLWLGCDRMSNGEARRLTSRALDFFVSHGMLNDSDVITPGWHASSPLLAQPYSGPASPYWAAKGFFGLVLPPDHRFWTAEEAPLPVEKRSFVDVSVRPAIVSSGDHVSGIVRAHPFGSVHARYAHDPHYAKLVYTSATAPDLDRESTDTTVTFRGVGGFRAVRKVAGSRVDEAVTVTRMESHLLPSSRPRVRRLIEARSPWLQRAVVVSIVRPEMLTWVLSVRSREPVTVIAGAYALADAEEETVGDAFASSHSAGVLERISVGSDEFVSTIWPHWGWGSSGSSAERDSNPLGPSRHPWTSARQMSGERLYVVSMSITDARRQDVHLGPRVDVDANHVVAVYEDEYKAIIDRELLRW